MAELTLGERIKAAREKKGLLQIDLANAIGVNSSNIISNWELNINKPDVEKAALLCKALGVSAQYILNYYDGQIDLSIDEIALVRNYRKLNDSSQESVQCMMESMLEDEANSSDYPPLVTNAENIHIPDRAILSKHDSNYNEMKLRAKCLKKLAKKAYCNEDSISRFLWRLGYGDKICKTIVLGILNGWRVPSPETYEHIYSYLTGNFEVTFPEGTDK